MKCKTCEPFSLQSYRRFHVRSAFRLRHADFQTPAGNLPASFYVRTTRQNARAMKPIVTFFGTQPYEQESFDALNRDFGFEFRYFKGHLSCQTVVATHGAQAACIFVNDTADARSDARTGTQRRATAGAALCPVTTTSTWKPRGPSTSPSCAYPPIRPMPSRSTRWR